jgi:uncharacterized membrane protein YfcA
MNIMETLASYLLLFGAGCVAGALNVIAGGGSFLTLPILIFMGLPASVANGTNRVGILFQNVGAVWGFHRHRVLDWKSIFWAALPSAAGALLGTWLALVTPDRAFERLLAFLMVAVTLWTLWDPASRRPPASSSTTRYQSGAAVVAGFFLVGIYGGFVQAGVGFLVLAVTALAGFDLVRGNAVKVLAVLVFTCLSLAIFAWKGRVEWATGFTLAAGTVLGGQLGVHWTVLKGHRWIRSVVTVTVLVFAAKLWFAG